MPAAGWEQPELVADPGQVWALASLFQPSFQQVTPKGKNLIS